MLKAEQQREDIEEALDDLDGTRRRLVDDIVQPLNDIGEVEMVDDQSIEAVFKDLSTMQVEIVHKYNGLESCKDEVRQLQSNTEAVLEMDLGHNFELAGQIVKDLECNIEEIQQQKEEALEKLNIYQDMIEQAIQNNVLQAEDTMDLGM